MTTGGLFRARQFTTAVAGVPVTVPPAMADVWLDAITSSPSTGVVPGMCDQATREAVTDALLMGRMTAEDLWAAASQAIAEASGRPWWEAVRLAGMAENNRTLLGLLVVAGVHAHAVTFGAWCDAAFVTALQNMDDKKRIQFEADLRMPPGGDVDDLEGFDAVVW